MGLIELAFKSSGEEGARAQYILVGCEYTLLRSHQQGDDGAGKRTILTHQPLLLSCRLFSERIISPPHRRAVQALLHLQLRMLTKRLLARLGRLACPILRVERASEHLDRVRGVVLSKVAAQASSKKRRAMEERSW